MEKLSVSDLRKICKNKNININDNKGNKLTKIELINKLKKYTNNQNGGRRSVSIPQTGGANAAGNLVPLLYHIDKNASFRQGQGQGLQNQGHKLKVFYFNTLDGKVNFTDPIELKTGKLFSIQTNSELERPE